MLKKYLRIHIKTIPHKEQRYDTVGDYVEEGNQTFILVSGMTNWRYEALVAVHELIEYVIIKHKGIKIADIDAFDIQYENERSHGKHPAGAEPGNSKRAPYHVAHKFATKCERGLALLLGVNWSKYSKEVESL